MRITLNKIENHCHGSRGELEWWRNYKFLPRWVKTYVFIQGILILGAFLDDPSSSNKVKELI